MTRFEYTKQKKIEIMREELLKTKRHLENRLFDLTINENGEVLSSVMLKIELGINPQKSKTIEFLENEIFEIEKRINRI